VLPGGQACFLSLFFQNNTLRWRRSATVTCFEKANLFALAGQDTVFKTAPAGVVVDFFKCSKLQFYGKADTNHNYQNLQIVQVLII
jgi:hypothetical protein